MLISLSVRNFALIDHLELSFGDGLNILTGETGAGKSIIIDALGLALGERASADSIRNDQDKLAVEAVFSLQDAAPATKIRLSDNGLENEDDPDTLILSREISKSGKSQCRVNGRLVPTSLLRQIGQDLVDVHGQHEHQSLLVAETHIDLFDNWLGAEILGIRKEMSETYHLLIADERELAKLQTESRERIRNVDLYRFQRSEIAEAALQPGELEELTIERSRLGNSERLLAMAEEAHETLGSTAQTAVNRSLAALTKMADVDPNLLPIIEQLNESYAFLEEATVQLRHYRETLDVEPGRLEMVNARLDIIHSLQRKYGDSIPEILSYSEELNKKLFSLEDSEFREEELRKRINLLQHSSQKHSASLSRLRKQGAGMFSNAIIGELQDLAMNQTSFHVDISPGNRTSKGDDKVEFLISTNPGEPVRPLAKIASGGETSRLMLAIKSVLSKSSYIPTMIFDEIDSGIGGRTGKVLADKLASLSKISQILCVTHLPQIASRPYATHFTIEKTVVSGKTSVRVIPLGLAEREVEIARMLGNESSQTGLQHARELLSAN